MSTSQQLLLAKQGDPAAIAQLINQALSSKGMTAKVTRKDACLKVLLESEQVPDALTLVPYLQKSMTKLGMSAISSIEVYGKQAGAAAPAWHDKIQLNPAAPPAIPSPVPQPVATKPFVISSSARTTTTAVPNKPQAGKKPPTRQTNQQLFSIVAALLLILVGANLRSVYTLFTKPPTPPKTISVSPATNGVHTATIVGRWKGVPVIQVTFNGNRAYPMVVDTGAASTLITQSMASDLGVAPVGEATAQTANGYVTFNVGYVQSIEIEGAKIANVPVAIGLPDMTVGLLGHDFFGNYDVTVREKVVEFRPRQPGN